jgi:hypothetical protein
VTAAAFASRLLLGFLATGATGAAAQTTEQYRAWVGDMKESPRGPFSGIKWYCKDGIVLPPAAYAYANHGGGFQHGEWSDRTKQLRSQGYRVATLLAGIDAAKAVAAPDFPDAYAQLLVEKFLLAIDNGWILRKALFYRGALQEEDEREGARNLLQAMAARPEWIGYRFVALRTGVRMLPHGPDTASAQKVRQMAATLSERDAGFTALRTKIHNTPEPSDAVRVRAYAAAGRPELRDSYEELAAEIDRVYQPKPLDQTLEAAARAFRHEPVVQKSLRDARATYLRDTDSVGRYRLTAEVLMSLRRGLPDRGARSGARTRNAPPTPAGRPGSSPCR